MSAPEESIAREQIGIDEQLNSNEQLEVNNQPKSQLLPKGDGQPGSSEYSAGQPVTVADEQPEQHQEPELGQVLKVENESEVEPQIDPAPEPEPGKGESAPESEPNVEKAREPELQSQQEPELESKLVESIPGPEVQIQSITEPEPQIESALEPESQPVESTPGPKSQLDNVSDPAIESATEPESQPDGSNPRPEPQTEKASEPEPQPVETTSRREPMVCDVPEPQVESTPEPEGQVRNADTPGAVTEPNMADKQLKTPDEADIVGQYHTIEQIPIPSRAEPSEQMQINEYQPKMQPMDENTALACLEPVEEPQLFTSQVTGEQDASLSGGTNSNLHKGYPMGPRNSLHLDPLESVEEASTDHLAIPKRGSVPEPTVGDEETLRVARMSLALDSQEPGDSPVVLEGPFIITPMRAITEPRRQSSATFASPQRSKDTSTEILVLPKRSSSSELAGSVQEAEETPIQHLETPDTLPLVSHKPRKRDRVRRKLMTRPILIVLLGHEAEPVVTTILERRAAMGT